MTRLTKRQLKSLGLSTQSKYNSSKTNLDGHVFDSKHEAHRYAELKLLERAGQIESLELQPEFILQDGFRKGSIWINPIKYKADFRYIENGKTVVEDAKGYRTKDYLIKKKLFLAKYPDIDFREV